MTLKDEVASLGALVGRMDALLARLEAAVAAVTPGGGASVGPSDAPVDLKAYEDLIHRLKLEQRSGEGVPVAD